MGNIKKFMQTAEEKGGATFNINTGELNPDKGFATAVKSRELIIGVKFDDNKVQKYILKNIDLLGRNDYFLGVWRNSDGEYILDVVRVYQDLREALLTAKSTGQKAIFDFKNNKDIDVPKPQKAGTETQGQTYFNLKVKELVENYG